MPTSIPEFDRLLTQPQAAELANVHPHTIIRARRAGELQAQRFGRAVRIRESELNKWIDAHTERAS